MSNRRVANAVRRWLRHETAGRDGRAERALSTVFRRLPAAAPSAAFLGRVLAGAGFALPGRTLRDLGGLRVRAAIVACGVMVAAATAFLPSFLAALWMAVRSGKPIELAAEALSAVIQRVALGVSVWETLSRAGEAVGTAASSPTTLAILALCALVSLTAFRLLESLLISDRSTYHAEPR